MLRYFKIQIILKCDKLQVVSNAGTKNCSDFFHLCNPFSIESLFLAYLLKKYDNPLIIPFTSTASDRLLKELHVNYDIIFFLNI